MPINLCPYCQKDIDENLCEAYHYGAPRRNYQEKFDMACPYCGGEVEVEVIPVPEFDVRRKK